MDAVERPDGSVRLLIGDVCGHGPDEAALGACLRIAWRALVFAGVAEDRALPVLDDLLRTERDKDLFVTAADLTVSPDRRHLTYRLAGHWPPILLADGCHVLANEQRGLPLGIGTGPWADHHLDLPSAWELVIFTDGLIEGRNGQGEILGLDGLCGLLDELDGPLDGEALVAQVEALNGGPIGDDVALVALTFCPRGS